MLRRPSNSKVRPRRACRRNIQAGDGRGCACRRNIQRRAAEIPAGGVRPPPRHPVRLVITDDCRRNRWTVLFRALFVIPHLLWLGLWGVGALVAAVINWFAVLAIARSPRGLHQ